MPLTCWSNSSNPDTVTLRESKNKENKIHVRLHNNEQEAAYKIYIEK